MKKIIKKIESNKILFSITILVGYLLFLFITNGFNGYLVSGWYGIVYYIYSLTGVTAFGREFIYELIWVISLLPVIFLAKNKYIFSEKRLPFKERLKVIWPLLLLTSVLFVAALCLSQAFRYFNFKEFIAILLLCIFVGIFEEFLCRGWLQNELIERFGKTRKGVIYSICISGFIFGCTHIINFFAGQDLVTTIIQIISAILFGIYLGSIYFKTKNIWTCVFLHGFWDFAIFMLDINKTNSCAAGSVSTNLVMQLAFMIMIDLPGLLTGLKILEKVSLTNLINPKEKFSELEIRRSESYKKKLSITQIVIVTVLSIIFIFAALVSIGVNEPMDTCVMYETVTVENASMTNLNYSNYDLNVSNITYNFSYDENGLTIKDSINNKEVVVALNNIWNFGIFEENNRYYILILSESGEDTVVNYSNFITKNMNYDYTTLDKLKDSFKQLELPNVKSIGYYTDLDNKKYPLFMTPYETYYIMDKDVIKQLVVKQK